MESNSKTKTKAKAILAACILAASVLFVYAQFQSATQVSDDRPDGPTEMVQNSPAASPQQRQKRPDGPPSREEREKMREQMIEELGLTDEQQAKLEEMRKEAEASGDRNPGQMFQAMREVLTPEQREKARSHIQDRMRQRMSRNAHLLSPEEQKKLAAKIEQRLQEMEERIANGEGPFPGMGPGGGGRRGRD